MRCGFLPAVWFTWTAHVVPNEVERAGSLQVAAILGGMTLRAV